MGVKSVAQSLRNHLAPNFGAGFREGFWTGFRTAPSNRSLKAVGWNKHCVAKSAKGSSGADAGSKLRKKNVSLERIHIGLCDGISGGEGDGVARSKAVPGTIGTGIG